MVDHEPTIAGTDILIGKLVVIDHHVHCARFDDKCVDAHGEFGKHGDERMVDVAGRHRNVQPQLQVRRRMDDLIQVDIGGKQQRCLAINN